MFPKPTRINKEDKGNGCALHGYIGKEQMKNGIDIQRGRLLNIFI